MSRKEMGNGWGMLKGRGKGQVARGLHGDLKHDLVVIEAPCSKLQGIFDPQGSYRYSNRSLTP
jgi:hypothetical protein